MNATRPERGVSPAARGRARRRALQALYAWQLSHNPIERVIAEFEHDQDMAVADLDYFKDLVGGTVARCADIDARLLPFLDRPLAEVDPIERAVLRLATYELLARGDVPYRVVLNEAIDVARRFGAEYGHTYVNGVLDRLARELRAAEYGR